MLEAARLLDAGQIGIGGLVLARHQTSGRGQRGNAWIDQPGDSLLATFISDIPIPQGRFGLIALASGVGIAQGLVRFGIRVGLKWPNDIMFGDRKLGGVLIQTRVESPLVVLTGVGINLHSVPADHRVMATSLSDVMDDVPSPLALAATIGLELENAYQHLRTCNWQWVRDQWTSRAVWIGQSVTVMADGRISGRLMGINEFGHIEIETSEGTQSLALGSLERGPRRLA